MKIKDIRVSLHSVPVKIPLIQAKMDVFAHGHSKQSFMFCEWKPTTASSAMARLRRGSDIR